MDRKIVIKVFCTGVLYLLFAKGVWAQTAHKVEGMVLDSLTNLPLAGSSVRLESSDINVSCDERGAFSLMLAAGENVLIIRYLGFMDKRLVVDVPLKQKLSIQLTPIKKLLEKVELVYTGYQAIRQQSTTGSFYSLGESQLNRRVGTDIISRLEDAVPGLLINRATARSGNQTNISIRGQSTLFARTEPLIILDNFQYEGDLSTINPNDIENVTILKDAAASSIWGARAGNGVIVITTKKGRQNQKPKFSLNSNLTLGEKPDLFYQPKMSTSDFIDTEKILFGRGFYNATENSSLKAALTPVIELLIAHRDGLLSAADLSNSLAGLKELESRRELSKFFYQGAVNQQYAFNVAGGSEKQQYYLSAGYDDSQSALKNNLNRRMSLQATNTYFMLKDRLKFSLAVNYAVQQVRNNNTGPSMAEGVNAYPYLILADEYGLAAPVNVSYRNKFKEQSIAKGLLDWQFRPLDELKLADNRNDQNDLRLNFGLNGKIVEGVNLNVLAQKNIVTLQQRSHQVLESYAARNLINNLSVVNADGSITRPVPLGGIIDGGQSDIRVFNLRSQLNINRKLGGHELGAIFGAELRSQDELSTTFRQFGYDPQHATFRTVDYLTAFPRYVNPASTNNIIGNDSEKRLADRSRSFYTNLNYGYQTRYSFSGSARIDQSNIFGVRTNQKSIPLWSVGFAWNIDQEPGFDVGRLRDVFSSLKLRLTYGRTGNVDRTLSAFTTAQYNAGTGNVNNNGTRLPYATIVNPPNSSLRWERVNMANIGIDFRTKNGWIYGSAEYYQKRAVDLIGSTPYAPSSGISIFKGNNSSTKGNGVDLQLNIQDPRLGMDKGIAWSGTMLFSYNTDRVTDYKVTTTAANYIGSSALYPMIGKPILAVYSYPWAGLDPNSGDPQGYLNGQISKDYAKLTQSFDPKNLVFHGAARPPVFGAVRNTLMYRGLSVSANVSYRFNYYFRRASITYGNTLGLGGHGDYAQRWQKPGDELVTNVPSLVLTANTNRDNFYRQSAILVERGDHIRLQDVNLQYTFRSKTLQVIKLSQLELYCYANNLGILWKKTASALDPDYPTSLFLPSRTISFGLRVGL